MAPSTDELWGVHLMPQIIKIDFLLPGRVISLNCCRNASLETIKNELWHEAAKYPMHHILGEKHNFSFISITQDGEREDFYDETRRLCDLRLFKPVLKVEQTKGHQKEKVLNSRITHCLGLTSAIKPHDLDNMKNPEVVEFRRSLFKTIQECVNERNKSEISQAMYQYPCEIEKSDKLQSKHLMKLEKGHIVIEVQLPQKLQSSKYRVAVQPPSRPREIIREILYKKIREWNRNEGHRDKLQIVEELESAFVLKVSGVNEYFLKDLPISQYRYIRTSIMKQCIPDLQIIDKTELFKTLPNKKEALLIPSYMKNAKHSAKFVTKNKKKEIIWNTDASLFRVHVVAASNINTIGAEMAFVRVGLFHGTEPLCQLVDTKPIQINPQKNLRWDEMVTLEIQTLDLPRAAKLCVSVCAAKRRNKNHDDIIMLGWGNINIFDYKSILISGKSSVYLRDAPRDHSELLFPIGETSSNFIEYKGSILDLSILDLEFEKVMSNVLTYPTDRNFKHYATYLSKFSDLKDKHIVSDIENKLLKDIVCRDPLADISEQEKNLIWRLRHLCKKFPDILPRLLDSVKWNSRDHITQLYMLLDNWPKASIQIALELLDCKYTDPKVRELAISWLNEASDEELSPFLLQLVQTLKYEPYLDNNLSHLLLRRSLLNCKIGYLFFWHLKCELHSQSVCAGTQLHTRFCVLLEAYCRGLGPYLHNLLKQVEALDKLTALSESLKDKKTESIKEQIGFLLDQIQQEDYIESLQCFHSPLDSNVVFGKLIISECKIMNSAKKPLWLVWKNQDPLASDRFQRRSIIFKNGDDLRQDMLTLQVIRIMDQIWRQEGMDLRMTPYSCLATGNQVGIIEFVHNAKTVYNIQRQGNRLAAMQFDSTQLYKWISVVSQKGGGQDRLDQAIETFTLSCAGYCVATFILGIGDRHPDNIMVSEDGQIFHIDFGHFLGHFKKKFGITRERVPFVLTDDFLLVIGKGKDNPKRSEEFAKFQEYCGQAYLALRRHSNLLITLFTMMLPAGITELSSIDNISYLRQTLAVEKNEEEALKYFQTVFNEAYEGAWTTKVDWFFHSVRHGVSVTT